MNLVQKIEKLRIEISKLKTIILGQEECIEEQATAVEEDFYYYEIVKKEKCENEQKLNNLLENFNNVVTEVKQNQYFELVKWINLHKETITTIKNFIKSIHFEGKTYTGERTDLVSKIHTSWDRFIDTKQVPETHLLPDYEIFYEILQYKNKLKNKDIPTEEINKIEKLRQEIAVLSKK